MRLLLAAAAALAFLPGPADLLRPPDWLERWLYNPRERTERGLEEHAAGRADEATRHFDRALRLGGGAADDAEAPPDPRLLYNAGTGHLAAGGERRAVDLLERAAAAEELPGDLGSDVHYNLGNAKLAAGDPGGAVAAFEEALRRAPDDEAAKHNLEVALRRLEQQNRLSLPPAGDGSAGDEPGGASTSDRGGSDRQGEEPRPEDAPSDPQAGQPPRDGGRSPEQPEAGGEQRGERPLPRFEDQPDMTAEQAAALLEAVENPERRQRQERAAEQARRVSAEGKDW
ncbi:MAG TPA: tetratricopeptide repeat protein [Thermoanaerobaculia bacterium]